MSKPAEVFPVSSFVIEEMAERGWTPEQLHDMLGWSHAALDALLVQDEPLTPEQAADLERVFQASQSFWLNLEVAYRRWRQPSLREQHRARHRKRAAARQEGTGE